MASAAPTIGAVDTVLAIAAAVAALAAAGTTAYMIWGLQTM
jgi:hypothetical protein